MKREWKTRFYKVYRRADLGRIFTYKYLKEECKEYGAKHFSVMPSGGTRRRWAQTGTEEVFKSCLDMVLGK